MNLLYLNEHVCVCPPLTKHLSVSDEGDLVRVVINPDCIPSETHFELMATFAEEHMMSHFAKWEDAVEFALCFVLDGDDCMVLLEVSHPSGMATHFSVDASEEEIATMLAPLVVSILYRVIRIERNTAAKVNTG